MLRRITVSKNGSLIIPADVRRRHGLAGGGLVSLEETSEGVVMRAVETRKVDDPASTL